MNIVSKNIILSQEEQEYEAVTLIYPDSSKTHAALLCKRYNAIVGSADKPWDLVGGYKAIREAVESKLVAGLAAYYHTAHFVDENGGTKRFKLGPKEGYTIREYDKPVQSNDMVVYSDNTGVVEYVARNLSDAHRYMQKRPYRNDLCWMFISYEKLFVDESIVGRAIYDLVDEIKLLEYSLPNSEKVHKFGREEQVLASLIASEHGLSVEQVKSQGSVDWQHVWRAAYE